ncbi:2-succinyl-5-enolpyruvyl-6-hydroxy-3-cyclohexene-1-carboxylate synthase [Schaalia vaccimaxillae]|uniref:2-succinyl-5-enolpyruvyl-6-hydroxy-3- cyclohexene-1-carboxylate synthase n=1 Tax=Schaalia vaccimaxillae TaxID=183916 RepID=UPI0004213592|nr:thiamine pyrophosphate-binding protein [Schaalia vaccimaxillae]
MMRQDSLGAGNRSDEAAAGENPSILAASMILQALAAAGVRDVVYCPGSRSAPFAYALDALLGRGILRAHVRLDERSAAFLAVGLSRGSAFVEARACSESGILEGVRAASPVAVVTTSGGAVAELHAGIAEAYHARLPIITVTADRPFEMRGVGASQTTDQPGMFGSHVRGVWDVPAGVEADHRLAAIVSRAVAAAVGAPSGTAGPVQINVGLRDPLTPAEGAARVADEPRIPLIWRSQPQPCPWERAVDAQSETVIVAGDGADLEAREWARRARIPILAEPTSGLTGVPEAVAFQQALLSSSQLVPQIRQVIVTGRPTLSRPVSALLARPDIRIVVVDGAPEWADVAGRADVVVAGLAAPSSSWSVPEGAQEWFEKWQQEASRVSEALVGLPELAEDDAPSVVSIARIVASYTDGPLVLGASNSVRAFDLGVEEWALRPVVSNRGLAGIDGTIATAVGVAVATGRPTTAVMGDLTFFHDVGALSIPEDEAAPNLDVVVVDDHGGGIFAGLEHGQEQYRDVFERWFATPQSTSIEGLARAYHCEYVSVTSNEALREVLTARASRVFSGGDNGGRGIRVIHVVTPRQPDLFRAVRQVAHPRPSSQQTLRKPPA